MNKVVRLVRFHHSNCMLIQEVKVATILPVNLI